jgi:transposase
MTTDEEKRIREEVRGLRQRIAIIEQAWEDQKRKNQRLEKQLTQIQGENSQLKEDVQTLQEENTLLKAKLSATIAHKEVLSGMIFKPNVKKPKETISGHSRGGQTGHQGYGRRKPKQIDQEKHIYLTHCPNCQNKIDRTETTYERIIEDIQPPQKLVTLYYVERQWCSNCQKEVHATPSETLDGFRLGLNLITLILFLKYRLRTPLAKITEALKEQYKIKLTTGGIQNILHRLQGRFKEKYQRIIKTIRKSDVKYADETGWRVEGLNNWCWLFATDKSTYYTIEETRGKGVPDRVLGCLSPPQTVLVRDDYPAYEHLPIEQQSCWVHLLRKSREATKLKSASLELLKLHTELKNMFEELKSITKSQFVKTEREKIYKIYLNKLQTIQKRKYLHQDSQAIQMRIKNQDKNLLTAIKHPDVPLTNNHAERQLRPMVVTRKISGGSRSPEGAATHAVNMSIIQTVLLEGKSFFHGVKALLKPKTHQFVLEKTE